MAMVEEVTVDPAATRVARSRRRKRRRWPVVLVVLLVAGGFVGGFVYSFTGGALPGTPGPAGPQAQVPVEEPTARDRLPAVDTEDAETVADRIAAFAELPATEHGAAQAATAQLALAGSTDMFRPGTRAAILDAAVDPQAPASYVEDIETAYTEGLGRLGLTDEGEPPAGMTFHARELILGVKVTEFGNQPAEKGQTGDPVATVEIWHGGLVGLTGDASSMPVRVAFNTTTVHLRHDGTTWRWSGHSREDGPVPVMDMQMPSGSDDLEQVLTETEEPSYA